MKVIQGRSFLVSIGVFFLPTTREMSAAIRSAAASASVASAVVTSGSMTSTGSVALTSAGASSSAIWVATEAGDLARVDDPAGVAGDDLEVECVGGLDRRLDGLDPEPRGDRVDAARQLLRVERDAWLDVDPADRRAGVRDGPVDGGSVATDGQCLVDERLGIEAAADLGVGDDRRAVRADEADLSLGRRAVCGFESGLRLVGGLPRQVDAADLDAGKDAAGVLLIVGVQRAGTEAERDDEPDQERDAEAQTCRGAAARAASGDGIGDDRHERGHPSRRLGRTHLGGGGTTVARETA